MQVYKFRYIFHLKIILRKGDLYKQNLVVFRLKSIVQLVEEAKEHSFYLLSPKRGDLNVI